MSLAPSCGCGSRLARLAAASPWQSARRVGRLGRAREQLLLRECQKWPSACYLMRENFIPNFRGWLSDIITSKPRKFNSTSYQLFQAAPELCSCSAGKHTVGVNKWRWSESVCWDTACSIGTALDKCPASQLDIIDVLCWKIGQVTHVSLYQLPVFKGVCRAFYHIPGRDGCPSERIQQLILCMGY